MTIKEYLTEQNIPEHNANIFLALDFEQYHETDNYFYNAAPITYDEFIIALDCSSATKTDFLTYEKLKKHFNRKGYHITENSCFGTLYLHVMTTADYDKADLYNGWKYNSVKTVERIDHAHHAWTVNHQKQFNNHIRTIMDYYGNLYVRDKADLLADKMSVTVRQDIAPDADDYLPF